MKVFFGARMAFAANAFRSAPPRGNVRMRTSALHGAVAAWMLALGACASSPKPATLEPRADAMPVLAARKGVDFLLSRQNADGSWGTMATRREREVLVTGAASFKAFSTATTALCVSALLGASRTEPKARAAVSKALDYLLRTPVADRGDPQVFCEVWSHTYRADVMVAVLSDRRFADRHPKARQVLQSDVDSLVHLQAAEGGYPYYDFGHSLKVSTGKYSTTFNTAVALRALMRARGAGARVSEDTIIQARRALLAMRSPEGTFVYGFEHRYWPQGKVNRPQGAMGRTSACLLALAETAPGKDEAAAWTAEIPLNLRRFRDNYQFLLAAYARPVPHEAYYANAGYFVCFGLCYAAEAAERLGDENAGKFAAWQAAEVAALQSDVGSWMDFPLYGYGQYYSTAYALMALQADARVKAKRE